MIVFGVFFLKDNSITHSAAYNWERVLAEYFFKIIMRRENPVHRFIVRYARTLGQRFTPCHETLRRQNIEVRSRSLNFKQ
jgi:hypothetical protein